MRNSIALWIAPMFAASVLLHSGNYAFAGGVSGGSGVVSGGGGGGSSDGGGGGNGLTSKSAKIVQLEREVIETKLASAIAESAYETKKLKALEFAVVAVSGLAIVFGLAATTAAAPAVALATPGIQAALTAESSVSIAKNLLEMVNAALKAQRIR